MELQGKKPGDRAVNKQRIQILPSHMCLPFLLFLFGAGPREAHYGLEPTKRLAWANQLDGSVIPVPSRWRENEESLFHLNDRIKS